MRLAQFFRRNHVDGHVHRMSATSEKNAFDRTYVGIIAAPGDGDVSRGRYLVIRWIEIDPTSPRNEQAKPCVRGIGANQPLLARARVGQEIAAYVASNEAQRPQTGYLQMREILADTAALLENFHRGRADARGGRVVFEFVEDARREIERSIQ